MTPPSTRAVLDRVAALRPELTPKGQILADFVLANPRKVVFMTTKQLAEAGRTSESTVVRFVAQLGYKGYGEFIQALRDTVDTEMNIVDRVELTGLAGPDNDRVRRVILDEIDNLRQLYASIDTEALGRVVDALAQERPVYVIGSRVSYTAAYYLGWSLTKVRPDVRILKGSDSTTIDWLTIAPAESLVMIVATSRYPNELVRIARLVRRLDHTLVVIADGSMCPLIPLANLSLLAPSRRIPIIGSPSTMTCLVNCIISEFIASNPDQVRKQQERLELSYLENDVLFNLFDTHAGPPGGGGGS
ncbi:MAG: MurR/RpiR family transcriptional regulator [Deltaproteobacteria bacterium]|nr:MurR/RpiR family transcriptional regulator [Deltaproteobacteria bacterium]